MKAKNRYAVGEGFVHNGIPYQINGVVREWATGKIRRVFAERVGHLYADGKIYDVTKPKRVRL